MAIVGHWRPWGSYFGWVVRCRCLFAPMLGFPCLFVAVACVRLRAPWPFRRVVVLVKGSARIWLSNDSVGPCWLKNRLIYKFGASSNLYFDLTGRGFAENLNNYRAQYHCALAPPHIYCGRGSGAKVGPRDKPSPVRLIKQNG